MSKNDFPDIEDVCLGSYHGLSPQSRAIYLLALFMVIGFMLCLPFIKIDISVGSPGVLQTSANKIAVSSSINGKVVKSLLRENKNVEKGDTLLLLDASSTEKQVVLNFNRQLLLQQYLDDIQALLKIDLGAADAPQLKSGRYQSSYSLFLQEKAENQQGEDQEARSFERFNTLYQKKYISDAEFERHKSGLAKARMASSTHLKRYRAQLEQEVSTITAELKALASAGIGLQDQRMLAVVRSPGKGSLQLRKEIKDGTNIVAHDILAEISPDSALMAYCYVDPADIALIQIGQEVYFQVTAFNYTEWGVLAGRVQEISEDVLVKSDGTTVYQIRCPINRDFMELKNGFKVSLKKGMTLNARFRVDKRSLSQLLYDKVDDWINPIQEPGSINHFSQQAK